MPFGLRLATIALSLAVALGSAAAAKEKNPAKGTGLTVPRFVTLRSNEVNARSGPGVTYPIEWVFTHKEMPVEITQEFDTWRRIRDWEGAEGWVHQSMLSGKRGVIVSGQIREVHREAKVESPVVARAQPGVIGWLAKCVGDWCQVDLKGHKGWLKRAEFWGVYPAEKFE